MSNTDRVLVDTNILLEDPDVLARIQQRGGLPFLTSTVLDELDYRKDLTKYVHKLPNQAAIDRATENARNAQHIFREFTKATSTRLSTLPGGDPLKDGDVLTSFGYENGQVLLLGRSIFRSSSNNDAKIIELAQDYQMILLTRDKGLKVRAEALGVGAVIWTGPQEPQQKTRRSGGTHNVQKLHPLGAAGGSRSTWKQEHKPFALCTSPIAEADAPLTVSTIPKSGDTVCLSSGHEFQLGKQISAGGEGTIYETQLAGQVCKIYHQNRLSRLRKQKIELMVSRRINRPGICWPSEIVTDKGGKFVGYIMPRAEGTTIQKAMFVKPVLEKCFPNWQRRDLVNVALTFASHVYYLHSLNIIVGDINPMNLLITEDSTKLWIVDTDSFQIENFPCPVGTVNFTPAEVQGHNYAHYLRTIDHEHFAVATMIFMLLFPGKPPYSQQGGGSPMDNIKAKNFPYRFNRDRGQTDQQATPNNAPQGPWQFIWGNLPYRVREVFYSTFREDKRASIDEWINVLRDYRKQIEQGYSTNELFPLQFKIRDPISMDCAKCSVQFAASQKWVEGLKSEGKSVWCPECAQEQRIKRLAQRSERASSPQGAMSATKTQWTQNHSTAKQAPPKPKGSTRTTVNIVGQAPKHPSQHHQMPIKNSGGLLGSIFGLFFK